MKEKIVNLFKNNKIDIILFSVEFCLSLFSVFLLYKEASTKNTIYYYLFLVVFVFLIVNIAILFSKYYKKLEYLFLIIMIPIGLGYWFLMIPNFVPDEPAHIARTYSVAEFDFFPSKNEDNEPILEVPKQLNKNTTREINSYQQLQRVLRKKTNYNNKENSKSAVSAGSLFIDYLVPSIGINIGKMINASLFISIYFARFLNLIFFVVCGFLIIKYIPFGKLLMFVYLLTPMILQQAASTSNDVLLNCSSLLLITYILHLKFEEKIKKLSLKNLIIIVSLMILIASVKIVYVPLVFLVYLLKDKIKVSEKKYKYIIYAGVIFSIILAIFCYYQNITYTTFQSYLVENNVDSIKQLKFVIKKPHIYAFTLLNTLCVYQGNYIYTFMGESLGWFNIKGAYVATVLLVVLFVIAPFLEKNKFDLKKKDKIILNILFLLIFNIILGAFYLSWSGVGTNVIEGVQGRYFIPIVILPLLTLVSRKKNIIFKRTNMIYFILLFLINMNSLLSIFLFFNK